MKRYGYGLSALLAVIAFTGIAACSEFDDERGKGDAPVNQLEDREVTVYPNGDGFPNIAFFCVGPNGVYTTTREVPPVVVAEDPNC